jgi:hypothetical protein
MTVILALMLLLGDDKAATDALEKFKADIKGKDGAGRAACVEELSKVSSLKIQAKLASLLGLEVVEGKVAAAKGYEVQEDKKHAVVYLLSAAPGNAKEPAVLAAIYEALGKIKLEAGAAEVNKGIESTDVEAAKAAVQAAGEIQSPTSFDPLIKALKECEDMLKPRNQGGGAGGGGGLGRFGGLGGRGGGPGGASGQDYKTARERAQMLKPEIQKVLVSMAKVNCQDAQDWSGWWKEHSATWKAEK